MQAEQFLQPRKLWRGNSEWDSVNGRLLWWQAGCRTVSQRNSAGKESKSTEKGQRGKARQRKELSLGNRAMRSGRMQGRPGNQPHRESGPRQTAGLAAQGGAPTVETPSTGETWHRGHRGSACQVHFQGSDLACWKSSILCVNFYTNLRDLEIILQVKKKLPALTPTVQCPTLLAGSRACGLWAELSPARWGLKDASARAQAHLQSHSMGMPLVALRESQQA